MDDGHLKAWRAHRLLAFIYGIGLLALGGFLYFGRLGWAPHTVFVAFSALPMLCVFHALAARGSILRKAWARIASLLMGVALLVVFPVGTIFGIFLLKASWKPWPDAREHAGAPRGGWPQGGRR